MKTINVRELRNTMPRLEETLAAEGELTIVSNGREIARVLPAQAATAPQRFPSLAHFRATMKMVKIPSEVLLREERDRRGS